MHTYMTCVKFHNPLVWGLCHILIFKQQRHYPAQILMYVNISLLTSTSKAHMMLLSVSRLSWQGWMWKHYGCTPHKAVLTSSCSAPAKLLSRTACFFLPLLNFLPFWPRQSNCRNNLYNTLIFLPAKVTGPVITLFKISMVLSWYTVLWGIFCNRNSKKFL